MIIKEFLHIQSVRVKAASRGHRKVTIVYFDGIPCRWDETLREHDVIEWVGSAIRVTMYSPGEAVREHRRCLMCGTPTEAVVNIDFNMKPLCNGCCTSITQQQVTFWAQHCQCKNEE